MASGGTWESAGIPRAGDAPRLTGGLGRVVLNGDLKGDSLGSAGKGLLEIANGDLEGVVLNGGTNDAKGGGPGVAERQL